MAEKAPLLTPPQTSELVLQLRTDRVRKLEFVAALTEGVILGVEQVQEIRLSNLEAGPEATIGDLVADAFWGFLFDSSINILFSRLVLDRFLGSLGNLTSGMHIMQARRIESLKADALRGLDLNSRLYSSRVAQRDLEILRSNFVPNGKRRGIETSVERLSPQMRQFLSKYENVGNEVHYSKLIKDATEEATNLFYNKYKHQQNKRLQERIKDQIPHARPNAFALLAAEARDFRVALKTETDAQSAVGVMVEQLLGATRRYLSDSGATLSGVPATDILSSVYAWASRQRQQIALIYENAESMLMQAAHSEDVGEISILLATTRETLDVDLGDIRARAWILSEAVIWAGTFRPNLLGRAGYGLGGNELAALGIPGRIADYLVTRFADDAWRWVKSPSADNALALASGAAMESTTTADVRAWAMQTLQRARKSAPLRASAPAEKNLLEKFFDPKAPAAQYDAIAVRAFLLAMQFLYRKSAQDLASTLEATKKELKAE